MAREFITALIPRNKPDDTLKLLDDIIERNTLLGVDSPIANDFDFVALAAMSDSIRTLRTLAGKAESVSQTKNRESLLLLGIAPGQNLQSTGTLKVIITKIKAILRAKYDVAPERLSVWGFNVVVSEKRGRRNVRVTLPVNSPEQLLKLAEDIAKRNTVEGVSSPLNGKVDMVDFASKTAAAKAAYDLANSNRRIKEAKNYEALGIMGYAHGQSRSIPGTAYNILSLIRNMLLTVYDQNPKELEYWGFHVVIKTGMPGRKKKKIAD